MSNKGVWDVIKGLFPTMEARQLNIVKAGLIIAGAGILFILLGGLGDRTPEPQIITGSTAHWKEAVSTDIKRREEDLARELALILGHVEGVGRVEVEVTLDTGPVQVVEYDTRQEVEVLAEKDSGGGERQQTKETVERKVVLIRDGQGGEHPLVVKEIQPQVRGVLIVAEGAQQAVIRAELARAASRALGVPLYRVMVLPYS